MSFIKMAKTISLRKLEIPVEDDIEKDLDWLCHTLGLVSGRDIDKTVIKLLKTILYSQIEGRGITSDELADKLSLSRGTIDYHLRSLIDLGLLTRDKNLIKLRSSSLLRTISEIKKEVDDIFEEVFKISEHLDKHFGLKNREL